MSGLAAWIVEKSRRERKRQRRPTLYSLIFTGKSWLYPLHRMKWPLAGAFYRSTIGFWVWTEISADLPLFSWNDLFTWMQVLYLLDFLVSALLETARARLREHARPASQWFSSRERGAFAWAQWISLAPLLVYGAGLASDLRYEGRYFGFYDALMLVLLARFWAFTLQKFEVGLDTYRSRAPIYAWNWLLPPLGLVGIYLLLRSAGTPYALVYAIAGETAVQAALQVARRVAMSDALSPGDVLKRYAFMVRNASPRFLFRGRDALLGLARRIGLLPLFGSLHFLLIWLFTTDRLALEETVLLHAISPLLSLVGRGAVVYWKDIVDSRSGDPFSRAIRSRLARFALGTSIAIAMMTFAASSLEWIGPWTAVALYWAAGLHTLLFFPMEVWLGGKLFPSFEKASGPTHALRLRRRFWSREIRDAGLAALETTDVPFRVANSELLVWARDDVELGRVLRWGRGWILEARPAKCASSLPSLATAPSPIGAQARFNLRALRWNSPTPPLPDGIESRHLFFERIHGALRNGAGAGKLRIEDSRFRWSLEGEDLVIQARERDRP